MEQIEDLIDTFFGSLVPPEDLTTSEWAEKYRVLAQESSAIPGRWHNEMTPYLREIMDLAGSGTAKEIVIMSSAQVGKSECLLNIVGYYIDIDPGPSLLLQPTIQMAEDFSKGRLAPMFRNCAPLRGKISEVRSRESSNTILNKSYPGGNLVISGSNSPASLSSRPIRLLLIDEVDRMETTAEGDPISLAEKRTITFHNRVVIKVSTPTVKDISRIERAFNRSDKRFFYVPCPHCGHEQVLKWKQVQWDKDNGKHLPDTARYVCEACKEAITDGERYRAVQKGKWKATGTSKVAGFHINELYSLFRKLSEIVQSFSDSKDNPETLRVWVNTTLGEPFAMKTVTADWKGLYNRREAYEIGTIPRGGIFLTGGADVQEDRIHVEIVAWGRNFETWSIEYIVLYGDTTQQEVWNQLDKIVQKTWKLDDGNAVGLSRFCIDAGFNTQFVHNFVRQYPANKVFAVVGRDNQKSILSVPIFQEVRGDKKRQRGLKSYPVGSSVIKQEIYGFLRQSTPMPGQGFSFGYCHFPQYDESYFLELTAEDLVKSIRKGFPCYEWRKNRPRNEALDCRVYGRAAACLIGIDRFNEEDWSRLEKEYPPAIQKRTTNQVEIERETVEDSIWR